MPFASLPLAALAGALSILSPCVLPLLPLVFGSAASSHRLGVPALIAGLVVSFVAVGMFVATIGFAIGLDEDFFRRLSALLLVAIALVLLVPRLAHGFARLANRLGGVGHRRLAGIDPSGPGGQFAIGLLLGAVWSPCAGPTLGAAALLAARGQDLVAVAAVMAAFGVGVALPLLAAAMLSRQALLAWRGRMIAAGSAGRILLGTATLLVALAILTGIDRQAETWAVDHSPDWLTDLTTRY